jgi:N-methylhydantoinase A
VEIVNYCVSGFGVIDRPSIPKLGNTSSAKPVPGTRPVYFGGSFRDTPIYQRSMLTAGSRLGGPAVVEEFGSTTVVFPGQSLQVDLHGILIVQRRDVAGEGKR